MLRAIQRSKAELEVPPSELVTVVSAEGCPHPIHNFPNELLSHVFKLGGETERHEARDGEEEEENVVYVWDGQMSHPISQGEGFHPTQARSFRAAVSSICRLWRNVAISTPSLWTTIVASPNEHSLEFVRTLLTRSRDLPIDIYVNEGADHTLYTLLAPHVHRWRSIEVDIQTYEQVYSFFEAISSPAISGAPQLQSLRMFDPLGAGILNSTWDTRLPTRSNRFETLLGGSVPRLRNLALCRASLDWDKPCLTSLFALTTLELRNHRLDARPSWKQLSSILRGTPALKKLTLYGSGPSSTPPNVLLELFFAGPAATADYRGPIPLLHLTDLTFGEDPGLYLTALLRNIYAPSLKKLTVQPRVSHDTTAFTDELFDIDAFTTTDGDDDDDDDDADYEEPPKFLNGLEHLAFLAVACMGDPEPLELLFDELHNLTSLHLHLTIEWLSTPVYLKLLLPEHGKVRMPRLETLIILTNSEKITIPLRHVVQQRKDAGFPLKSLYLQKTCRRSDEEDLRWFEGNSVTVTFFCLCLTKTSLASACWEHPKVKDGQPKRRYCNCCPPRASRSLKALKAPAEWSYSDDD